MLSTLRQGLKTASRPTTSAVSAASAALMMKCTGQLAIAAPVPAASVAAPASLPGALERMREFLPGLADAILMAVPKKKVSPSRRGHRNSAKYMRYQQVISQCPRCKRAFMQHVIPKKCAEGTCTSTP